MSTSDDRCNYRGFAKAKEAAERYTPKASQTPKTPTQGSKLAAYNASPLDADAVAPAGTAYNADTPKSVANQSRKRKHKAQEEHGAIAEAVDDSGEVRASPPARTPILDLLCGGIDKRSPKVRVNVLVVDLVFIQQLEEVSSRAARSGADFENAKFPVASLSGH